MKRLLPFLLCLPAAAHAAWTVKEIDASKKSVVIQSNPPSVIVKKAYVIDIGDGLQCKGPVTSTRSSYVQVDLSSCPHFDRIRGKMTAEEAVDFDESADAPVAVKAAPAEDRRLLAPSSDDDFTPRERPRGFVLRLGIPLSQSAAFPDTTVSDNSGTANGEITYRGRGGLSLRGDYMSYATDSWNWRFGARLDTKATFDEIEVKSGGATNTIDAGDIGISSFAFSGDAFYRWDSFYLGLGLALVNVTITNEPPAWKGLTSGLGIEFDLGWFVTDRVVIGMNIRSVSLQAKPYTSGTTTVNLRNGGWGTFLVDVGYLF